MTARHEIVFIDSSLNDYQTLLDGVPAEAEVHLLDGAGDGLEQMMTGLAGRTGIDAIHVLSHGEPGAILLCQSTLCRDTLPRYAEGLASLRAAMASDGEWLIYGCEVAQGDSGRAFVQALREITGLKIAAASHKIGAEALGGSWVLDIASTSRSQPLQIEQWQGILTTTAFDFSSIYNADVIVTGVEFADGYIPASDGFFDSSAAYIEDGVSVGGIIANGIPASGVIAAVTGVHPGFTLNMTGNNAWKVSGTGSRQISVAPGSYNTVHVFASAGGTGVGQNAYFNVVLHYSDGTSTISPQLTAPDWFDDSTVAGRYMLIDGMDRLNSNGTLHNANDPAIFGFAVTADSNKTLNGISIDVTVNNAGVFALFGGVATTETSSSALTPTVDNTAPVFQSAATSNDGSKVTLTYDGALNATTAAAGDFAVTTGGSPNVVTAVTVSGSTVELTLTTAARNGQTVTIAYTDPSGSNDINAVQDSSGNDAASFGSPTPVSVTNNVPNLTNIDTDSVAWAGVGQTVVLDQNTNATVYDAVLGALNSGNGNWAGASLSLQRTGTAHTADVFGFNTAGALFTVSGSNLQASGQTFATFTNAAGILTVNFTSSGTTSTTARVNDVLQRITYRNDTPSGDTQLTFSLSDGAGGIATAGVAVTSDTIYVTNASDTATIDRSNGVSFSEAVGIAAADTTGTQTIVLKSGLGDITLTGNLAVSENLTLKQEGSARLFPGSTLTINSGASLTTTGSGLYLLSGLAGDGNLTINSNSGVNVLVTGNNAGLTSSSTVTLVRGGLEMEAPTAIGAATIVANALINQGGLAGNSNAQTIGNTIKFFDSNAYLNLSGSALTLTGAVDLNGGSGHVYNNSSTTTTFSGVISNGNLYVERGTVLLSGTNTYDKTYVNGSASNVTLQIAGDSNLGTGAIYLTSASNLASSTSNVLEITGSGVTIDNNFVMNAYNGGGTIKNVNNVTLSGQISEVVDGWTYKLYKTGAGTLTLSGTSNYASGALNVEAGAVNITGAVNNAATATIASGAAFGGSGAFGGETTVQSGGKLGIDGIKNVFTIDDNLILSSGSTYSVEIDGTTAGTDYDKTVVNGTVNLTGATLNLSGSLAPTVGSVFTLIDNDSNDVVIGSFSGLAEGGTVTVNSIAMNISYLGGTGNDITLTAQMGFSALAFSNDSGIAGDFITNTAAQTVTATLSSALGSTGITIWGSLDNGNNWTDITNMVSGTALTWTGVALSGTDTFKLQARNASSVVVGTASQAYELETTAPTQTFSNLAFSADTGVSSTDFITSTATQAITATLSGALGGTDKVFGSLDNGANWIDITNTVSVTALTWNSVSLTGSSTLKLKVIDLAGNDGSVTSQPYVLDTSPPVFLPATSTPADNANTFSIGNDIVVKFGEHIDVSSDLTKVYLKDVATDTLVPASVTLNANGNIVINPTGSLAYGTNYYVTWDANALKDSAGNAISAVADETTFNFTTEPAPSSGGGGSTAPSSTTTTQTTTNPENGTTTTTTTTTTINTSNNGTQTTTQSQTETVTDPTTGVTDSSTTTTTTTNTTGSNGSQTTQQTVVTTATTDGADVNTTTVTATTQLTDPATGQTSTVSTATTTTVIDPVPENRAENDPTTSDKDDGATADVSLAETSTGQDLLAVSLPSGVGLQAEGPSTPQPVTGTNALLDLIARIDQKTEDGSEDANVMTADGQQFLQELSNRAAQGNDVQLTTRTLVPTVTGDTPPPQPLVISGNTDPNNPVALVIDVSQLPPGTKIQLKNVAFAVIIGHSTAEGGDGPNYVVGDKGNQTIILGADDDTLRGGAGDDVIGSKTGNDQLYGDDGNDTVFGGEGDDSLFGGDGNDLLQGDEGNDVLSGGSGLDILVGGTGLDRFEGSLTDFNGDTFNDIDFQAGEFIRITGANILNNALSFAKNGNQTLLGIDETGDGIADSQFTLPGEYDLGFLQTRLSNSDTDIVWNENSDNDGIPTLVENQVNSLSLNGQNSSLGDGNGDGIADALQPNVASTEWRISASFPTANKYLTLVSDAKDGKIIPSDTPASQITSLKQLDAPGGLPKQAKLALDTVELTATTQQTGGLESFSVYVDEDLPANGFWVLNSKGTWVNLSSIQYQGQLVSEGDKLRLDFTIRDGGLFDKDLTANGVIQVSGVIGQMPLAAKVVNDGNKAGEVYSSTSSNDILVGNQGRDHLWGGTGDNWFVGGRNKDVYHFNQADLVPGGMDSILDGNGNAMAFGKDLMSQLKIGGQSLSNLLKKTQVGSFIDQNNSLAIQANVLQIDVNGDGLFIANDDFQVQLFNKALPKLTFSPKTQEMILGGHGAPLPLPQNGGAEIDTLLGDNKRNTLKGFENDDVLVGQDGGDTLIGGSGDDVMVGGLGWDRYLWSSSDFEANGVDQVIDGRGSRLIFDNAFLDSVNLNGKSLASIVSRKVVIGEIINADNGIAYHEGAIQIDLNSDGIFQTETDFQIEIIGTNSIKAVSFNGVKDWLILS